MEEFDQMRQDYDNLCAEIEEKNAEIEKLKDAESVAIETRDSRGDYTTTTTTTTKTTTTTTTTHRIANDF